MLKLNTVLWKFPKDALNVVTKTLLINCSHKAFPSDRSLIRMFNKMSFVTDGQRELKKKRVRY